jgi:uncharacterized protein
MKKCLILKIREMNNTLQKLGKETVEKLILEGYEIPYFLISGSQLYGTANENSDIDFRGVFFAKFNQRVGFSYVDDIDFGEDGKLYEVKKFIRLLADNNPNILEWVFAPKSNVFRLDPDFKDIVFADKQQFVNPLKIQKKFVAYAMSEMSRLKKLNGKTGEKRRGIIEKYGYNVKSASNVMRIACGGIDLCSHGHLKLPYENRDLLLEIKNGKYSFEEFMSIALPKVEKLRALEGLEDKTDRVNGYAQGVLISYIKAKM